MESWDIILQVLIMLAAALVLGTIAEQLRQSAILGYLVAGTAVGPNGLSWVRAGDHVSIIAELGAALLLFTIGLEFSLRRLRRLGRVALLGGSMQVIVTLAVAAAVARWRGMPAEGAVGIGAMVALSSTACVFRLLLDRGTLDSIWGRNAVGILLLQDAAVIPLIILVLTLGGTEGPAEAVLGLGRLGLLGAGLLVGFYLLSNFVVPRVLNLERWARNRELPILLAIILVAGSAAAAHAISLSPAIGAFIAGVLLGESPFAPQIRADVGPLRTLLVTLFFASIGMIGEPAWALAHWHLVVGVVLAVLLGKTLIVAGIVRVLGFPWGIAAATGMSVAQVGEFSFVLADTARRSAEAATGAGGAAIISDDIFRLIVSVTITTLFVTPFLVAAAPRVAQWIESYRRMPAAAAAPPTVPAAMTPGILVVGFGPAGQAVCQALFSQHRERIAVIDLSPRRAQAARHLGLTAHIGDATNRDMLEFAGIDHVRVVAITIPDPGATRNLIHLCRQLVPQTPVVARARYHNRRWEMELAGAREVVDEEEQVGLRIAALVRRHLAPLEEPGAEPA
jgi:CPA2 family monovalent cation:H+ antiporter-2